MDGVGVEVDISSDEITFGDMTFAALALVEPTGVDVALFCVGCVGAGVYGGGGVGIAAVGSKGFSTSTSEQNKNSRRRLRWRSDSKKAAEARRRYKIDFRRLYTIQQNEA